MVKVRLQIDTNYGILYQKVQQKSCAFFYSYETGGSSVDKIGKYRVLKKIGSGGTGSVYVVLDDRIGKKWAMKELPKSKKGGRDGLFVLKGLDHPSIPRIVEELEDEYCVYEIMDYIEGVTLAEYAGAGRIRSAEQLLAICTEISGIIAYLHSQEPPIIFRDIKPDNFIVTGDGNIKLVDFDIALVGEQTDNMPLGTRGYAAPEQHFGICSMAADVYSLGVTIGELAHKLRLAPGISRVFDKRILMKIRRVSGKAAGKDPVSRYSDAGAVWEEMVRIRRTYRAERTAAIAGTVLLLLTVLTASLRGIYRDAVKSDARNRVLTYLESSRKTADRIMCELAEDRGADVDEDLAGFYKEVMKAGSLTKYTDTGTAREVIRQRILYYELAGSLADSEDERDQLYRKAIAEVLTLMENAGDEELGFLRLKAADLSRIVGDTGSAERLLSEFIREDSFDEEKISAWVKVIAMRLYDERNSDTAKQALQEVLKIDGALENELVIKYKEIIESVEG